jgi:cyclin-dependent kinase
MHRNLKPDNIMVTLDGEVKLCDFSLSKLQTKSGTTYTPEDPKERERSGREARRLWYRAPEMLLRKSHYSSEIDSWSVGCIFAELAIGQPLFDGESEIEHLFKIYALTGSPTAEVLALISNGNPKFKIAAVPDWKPIYFTDICSAEKQKSLLLAMASPSR